MVRELAQLHLEQIAAFSERITELEKRLCTEANREETARRAQTMPGVGPVTAMAVAVLAPDGGVPPRARLAAWLGLVQRQHSTGGKPRLGKVSRAGQRDIRRLAADGAIALVHWAARKGEC